ncbi:hypothetical protein [Dactylosporangium sp. NPDC048998]|uniref:hypothetical protein n=1 Tax=Dactylosporangium sp. NPDC048998 TaxID=3363976 RepID=UPI00371D1037
MFIDALRGAARPFVMEIKRTDADGSPLVGDRPVADVVAAYTAAGAPCLSVVTGRWFGGSPDLLAEVAALTRLPLLQKDFVTRTAQLHTARTLGASAVLLTAGLLPRTALHRLVGAALELGLTPFVEVVSAAEIAGLPHADACVVAVNNKDINTRERSGGGIERSLGLLRAVLDSGTRCPVSASGIDRPEAAARLLAAGYAGLLVGTSLLRAGDLERWLAAFDHCHSGDPAGS